MKPERPPAPKKGDHVKLRGREPTGFIAAMDEKFGWCRMEWDMDSPSGPSLCHINELELV